MFCPSLDDYKGISGKEVIKAIRSKISYLKDKHIVFINSTYQGGGVAEMLNSIVPLFNKSGLRLGWRILHGYADFFNITKSIHNALQGDAVKLSSRKKELYEAINERFSLFTHLDHDLVVVHDPQPLPLIKYYHKRQPWLLRLHIDLSDPYKDVWRYVVPMINKYDELVISANSYYNSDITIPYSVIMPAIDPLSIKNRQITNKKVIKYLDRYAIPLDKPIISQVSRFDKWKDPLGVIKIFESLRKKKDATLILLGSFAPDDPEGQLIYNKVVKAAHNSKYSKDIRVLAVNSDILVNAVQRGSDVVIQKSLREGFGLVVSEAMYKRKAVVGSRVGGISLQIKEGYNGYLCEPSDYECFVKKILYLLNHESERSRLGENAYRTVIDKFLITRLMDEWLDLFLKYLS